MSFVIFGAKRDWNEFFRSVADFLFGFRDDFLTFVLLQIENGALGACFAFFANSKEAVSRGNSYEVDALGAFWTRNEELSIILNVKDDHIMASYVE